MFRISTCLHEDAMTRLRTCPLQCIYLANGASSRSSVCTPMLSLDMLDVPLYPWPRMSATGSFHFSRVAFISDNMYAHGAM